MIRSQHRRGFTLVELLVVIGIIALLISILLPSLSKARTYAKKVQCMSNLRQMYMATVFYAGENKDWPPFSMGNAGSMFWSNIIVQELGRKDGAPDRARSVLQCPSAPTERAWAWDNEGDYGKNIAMDGDVNSNGNTWWGRANYKLTELASKQPPIAYILDSPCRDLVSWVESDKEQTYYGIALYRHSSQGKSDGANCLYYDGSVAPFDIKAVEAANAPKYSPYWMWTLKNPWTPFTN